MTGWVDVPRALVLPVRISRVWILPAAVRAGVLQLPVIPAGSPVTVKLAAEALEASETPPTGLTVTVTDPVDIDVMLSEAGESMMAMAGAAVTRSEAAAEAMSPSPVAVILRLVVDRAAVAAGLRVRVETTLPSVVGV